MAKKVFIFVLSICMIAGMLNAADNATPLSSDEVAAVSNIHNVFRRAVEQVKPAVVTVKLYHELGYTEEETGLGSGFIIDERGYILTNNHVAEGNDKMAAILDDGRVFEVTESFLDPITDLAVIKIDPKGEKLPTAKFGNSAEAKVGDFVMAIGSPFGLTQTVTMGIISYKGRQTKILGNWGIEDFIQTDADINKGNSGGPLINLYGEVIGINSNIFSPSGLSSGYGFAVPSNIAKYVSEQLIENQTVKRGYLGVKLYKYSVATLKNSSDDEFLLMANGRLDEASQLKTMIKDMPDDLNGIFIMDVEPGTPAAKGGMEPYDVVIGYNGKKPAQSSELRRMIAMAKPGTESEFEVWRNGKIVKLQVTLSDRDNAIAQMEQQENRALAQRNPYGSSPYRIIPQTPIPFADQYSDNKPKLGIKVEELSPTLAKQYGYPNTFDKLRRVIITSVNPGSLAEKFGLNEGDIIISVNSKKVVTPAQLKEIIISSDLEKGIELKVKNPQGDKTITVSNDSNDL